MFLTGPLGTVDITTSAVGQRARYRERRGRGTYLRRRGRVGWVGHCVFER